MVRRRLGTVLAVCMIGLSFGACTKNVATGKRILTLGLSRDQEIALGTQAAPEFTQEYGGAVNHAGLQQYVAGIGQKMAATTEGTNPTLPWEFTLLNTEAINAFALPGGKVFFTRGLAERLTSEAQMAGVLGHEIGHVTAQHGTQRIASSQVFAAGVGIAAVVVGASDNQTVKEIGGYGVPALAIGGSLVMLKFGRNEELEADRLGVRYMTNVGYNPRGQLEVMQVLQQLSQGNSTPAFLSTHPDPAARVQAIQQLLDTDYAFTQGSAQHQDFKDRYKTQFLDVIKNVPKPPKPAATGALDPANPSTWCLHCAAAAEEAVPVPPRKGVYAFFAPAAR
ncbi:MAG: M48 family metalloprotease [Phycisphaeraceae bacterium]|nr:M48 family metalloprotease [Phycisphaeraceae bacterium]